MLQHHWIFIVSQIYWIRWSLHFEMHIFNWPYPYLWNFNYLNISFATTSFTDFQSCTSLVFSLFHSIYFPLPSNILKFEFFLFPTVFFSGFPGFPARCPMPDRFLIMTTSSVIRRPSLSTWARMSPSSAWTSTNTTMRIFKAASTKSNFHLLLWSLA